jgi:hypothetical protein
MIHKINMLSLWYGTSKFHTQRVQRRVMEMVNDNIYDKYKTFALRAFEPKERLHL